jgi:hypothetical protein
MPTGSTWHVVYTQFHNMPLFRSRVIRRVLDMNRQPSYSKLIFTSNTRNAGSKSHLYFYVKLFSLFLQNKYNSIHFIFRQELNIFMKASNSFLNSSILFWNQIRKIPPFAKKIICIYVGYSKINLRLVGKNKRVVIASKCTLSSNK